MCMRRLIEEGADIHALTNENKSPVKLAEEMKCILVFHRALQDSGRYNDDMTPRLKPRLSNDLAKKIIFCSPFVCSCAIRVDLVYYLDCVGDVLCIAILFIILDHPRMAYWSECLCSEIRH